MINKNSTKEQVLEALKQNDYYAFFCASDELRNDKDVALAAVKLNGHSLCDASDDMRGHKEVVLEAVKQNGFALEYASAELQNDRDVVLTAVKQDGQALKYASEELQNDRDFIMESAKFLTDDFLCDIITHWIQREVRRFSGRED